MQWLTTFVQFNALTEQVRELMGYKSCRRFGLQNNGYGGEIYCGVNVKTALIIERPTKMVKV
ncbi:hypothetical protein ACVBKF_08440 [Shewanella sp. 0m-11]